MQELPFPRELSEISVTEKLDTTISDREVIPLLERLKSGMAQSRYAGLEDSLREAFSFVYLEWRVFAMLDDRVNGEHQFEGFTKRDTRKAQEAIKSAERGEMAQMKIYLRDRGSTFVGYRGDLAHLGEHLIELGRLFPVKLEGIRIKELLRKHDTIAS